ncbi:MAG TPA: hypothetical protein GX704_04645 [Clostridiales bacterium]|jgi:hypothetical protein|nr:hypothetical protein [Clostridiales bacterium]
MFRPRAVFFIAAVLIALCLTQAVPAFAADIPFAEFIPASSCKIDGSAVALAAAEGSINEKVISAVEKADNADGDGFILTLDIPAEGDYTIWGRVYYPSLSNNSMHYSVDGGDGLVWDFPDEDEGAPCYNKWSYMYLTYREDGDFSDTELYGYWTIENSQWRHSPNTLHLTAGKHEIRFTPREDGWLIDEFVVTTLSVLEYDPAYFEGNDTVLDPCKFCGPKYPHYCQDIYALTGETAKNYFFNTLYKVEEEAPPPVEAAPEEAPPAAEAAPVAAAPPPAPAAAAQTGDITAIGLLLAAGAAAAFLRKKR